MNSITISPAYGRDYKSKAAMLADFNENKDFVIESIMHGAGRYCNRADLAKAGFTQAEVRYGKKRKVAIVKL